MVRSGIKLFSYYEKNKLALKIQLEPSNLAGMRLT